MKNSICGLVVAAALTLAAGATWAADGKAVFDQNCATCHKMLSPKLGDRAAWAPRIKQGNDALVASVVKGKGAMPPRAGQAGLSDDDIKAAVGYVVGKSQ